MHVTRHRQNNRKPAGWWPVWRGRALQLKPLLLASFACSLTAVEVNAQQGAPELLTYDELVQLYEQETPPEALQNKLRLLLTTPFVSNAATARGARPLLPSMAKLGRVLRMIFWNVERGLEYDAIRLAFTDTAGFARLIDSSAYPRGSKKRKLILEQAALLKQADSASTPSSIRVRPPSSCSTSSRCRELSEASTISSPHISCVKI